MLLSTLTSENIILSLTQTKCTYIKKSVNNLNMANKSIGVKKMAPNGYKEIKAHTISYTYMYSLPFDFLSQGHFLICYGCLLQ